MSQDKLLIYIIAFISLLAVISFFVSPFFKVVEISFEGYEVLTAKELNDMLQGYYHQNILLVDQNRLKNRLTRNSYIKDATVIKKYPDKLKIVITERVPLARINNNGKFIFFTEDGYILEEGSMKGRTAVPLIKGLGYTITQNKIAYSPVLSKIVQALAAVDSVTRGMITQVEYQSDNIEARINNIPVLLGTDNDLTKKLLILQSIKEKIEQARDKIEYIDLSILQKPVMKGQY